ncbi:MAG: hypothetical protein LDLANPLL_02344 [Turneriella sp.]|nr:hypothetical protein [Turneriella sp.]
MPKRKTFTLKNTVKLISWKLRKTYRYSTGCLLFLFAIFFFWLACKKQVDWKKEEVAFGAYVDALPDLRVTPRGTLQNPQTLLVRYVENPQLPKLTKEVRERIYLSLKEKALSVFGYHLYIDEVEALTIAQFFSKKEKAFQTSPIQFPAHDYLISWFSQNRDTEIEKRVREALAKKSPEILFAYFGKEHSALQVAQKFISRLGEIYAEKKPEGNPLLSAHNKEEEIWYSYGHWDTLLYAEKDVDFIFTNIGIIGADNGMPIYVIARGGVTSAFVENSAHRPYQGVGVFGAYPFFADTVFFNRERGVLTQEQKEETVVWVWLHELGHLLLKKEENYSFADSVHRAPPNLKYYEWVKRVRASKNHHTNEIPIMKKF